MTFSSFICQYISLKSSNIAQAPNRPGTYATASASTWTTCCLQTANYLCISFTSPYTISLQIQLSYCLLASGNTPNVKLSNHHEEQLSDTEPPSAISNHASYHFLLLLLPYLPLIVTSTLLLLALLYASWVMRACSHRLIVHILLPYNTYTSHALLKNLIHNM